MEESNILPVDGKVDVTASERRKNARKFYSDEGLAAVYGMSGFIRRFLHPQSPYLIEDYRCGLILSGSLRGRTNLIERQMTAGSLVYVSPGSFVEPLDMSEDLRVYGIGMTREVFNLINLYNIPPIFRGQTKDGCVTLTESEVDFIKDMFRTLWSLLQSDSTSKETKYCIVSAFINHFNDLFSLREQSQSGVHSSTDTTFNNFIALVCADAGRHRQLSFYADKMCITEHYLGSVIKKVSGSTAKDWIDRAAITAAKVMLRHTDDPISTVADKLEFPNGSFFSKYFKRLTGLTPQAFREG